MPVRKIVPKTPESLKPVQNVADFNCPYLKMAIQDLLDTLAEIQKEKGVGVGLAANQIEYPYEAVSETDPSPKPGFYPKDFEPLNVYVVSILPNRAEKEKCESVEPAVFINAHCRPIFDDKEEISEACLSVPGFRAVVPRYKTITVCFDDLSGEKRILAAKGFIARVHQHEIDHGSGEEYLNRLNFSESELRSILAWIELYQSNPLTESETVVENKLFLHDRSNVDAAALQCWVVKKLQDIRDDQSLSPKPSGGGIFSNPPDAVNFSPTNSPENAAPTPRSPQ